MAKADLIKQAQTAGLLADDVDAESLTIAQLEGMLSSERPAWEGSASATEPIVAADGHVVLSKEDIDARA